MLDNTDRNRTSPFAFTGNKFELRAAGSTANCAVPMTVLNTIVAEQLNMFKAAVDARIKGGDKKDDALLKELQQLIKDHKAIRFEGNGYGDAWVKEAKKRWIEQPHRHPHSFGGLGSKGSVRFVRLVGRVDPKRSCTPAKRWSTRTTS